MHQARLLEEQDALAGMGEGEVEEGMHTPASHLSDSAECTPTFRDVARAAPGVVAAAQAGSAAAADSLAPPEVRQRVLSDAAAELLTDELSDRQRQALLAGCSPSAAAAEAAAGAATAEAGADVPAEDDEVLASARSADDPMIRVYRAARAATLRQAQQLEHQGSDVTLGQPTPRARAQQREGTPGSEGFVEEEATPTMGTPPTPSTGAWLGDGWGSGCALAGRACCCAPSPAPPCFSSAAWLLTAASTCLPP